MRPPLALSPAASAEPIAGAANAAPAIETRELRKEYGRRVALHGLTLSVGRGEVFGFLGPNGAGKTTCVKVLTGLVRATSGEARVLGRPVGDPEARRRLGYLPENFRFHDWLTGHGLLDFHGRLAGISEEERRARIPAVLERVGLAGRGGDKIRGYSKGMTQRVGLAQAIVHRPDVVLLDEPTSALDPIGRREVRDLIRTLKAEGTTVFLNSHLLSEVEMVCDRVAIVDRGRVVWSGTLLGAVSGIAELRVTLDRVDAGARQILARHGDVVSIDGPTANLGTESLEVAPALAEELVRAGYRLYGLVPHQRSLEDVFVAMVEGREG